MALIFFLSAECGTEQTAAEGVAQHFQGVKVQSLDGSVAACHAGTSFDGNNWWADASTDNACCNTPKNAEDLQKCTEIGFALFERLKSAPPFRYAAVGIEVQHFRFFHELSSEDLAETPFEGVVLSDAVWLRFGSPARYIPFAPGYRWVPFVAAS